KLSPPPSCCARAYSFASRASTESPLTAAMSFLSAAGAGGTAFFDADVATVAPARAATAAATSAARSAARLVMRVCIETSTFIRVFDPGDEHTNEGGGFDAD